MLICCSGVQDIKQHSRPFWLAHTSVLLQILAFWSLWQVDVDLGKLRLRPRIQRAVHWDDTRFQQTLQAIQRWRQACHRLSLLDRVGFFKWVSWCCFGVVWCWGCSDHSGSRSFASFWIPRQFFVAVFLCVGDFVVQVWRSNGSLTFCIGLHCFLIVWWWNNMKQLLFVVTRCFMLNVMLWPGQTHLDSLTFNLLNQTKTLSAALICYLMLGRWVFWTWFMFDIRSERSIEKWMGLKSAYFLDTLLVSSIAVL